LKKPEVSFPPIFFAVAILIVAGFFMTRRKQTLPSSAAMDATAHTRRPSTRDPSKTFDDERVSFRYPASFEVWTDVAQEQNRRIWVTEYPDQDPARFAKVVISEYLHTDDGRSLTDIYKSKRWDAKRIHPPETIAVDGGNCLTYRLDYALDDNRVDQNGRTRTISTCTRVENQAHCRSDDGRYFELHALNGGFCDQQNPDPLTQAKIKSYDLLIRSLKFKSIG